MADKDFQLRIITPERVFYEGIVDMVEFNTTEGQIGVLPGHIPLTVIVKPGILHITEKDGEKEAALHSGFAEILPEGVTFN
jgi:F-type H+-transporting ATPase subunit epsilon